MKASSSVILAAIRMIMALLKSPAGNNNGNSNDGHYFCFVVAPNHAGKHFTELLSFPKNVNIFWYLVSKICITRIFALSCYGCFVLGSCVNW